MLRNVAAVVTDGFHPFELGVVCEAFGLDRSAQGCPVYEFEVVTPDGGTVRSDAGFLLTPERGLDRLAEADLVCVPAWPTSALPLAGPVREALHEAHDRGARLLSVCTGAFALAAAGLLDGRRATTHWMHTERFAAMFPQVELVPDVLYVDDDPIFTSAGTAAGIDCCLHLMRREHGPAVANTVARRMVVPPHRAGGQAQYVEHPLPPRGDCDLVADLLPWVWARLDRPISVDEMAAVVHLSPRTFARTFRARTGTTPYAWLLSQRVLRAEELLERGDLGVDEIARETGFGSAAAFRQQFARVRGVAPSTYRSAFTWR